jgi:hypothetical protein
LDGQKSSLSIVGIEIGTLLPVGAGLLAMTPAEHLKVRNLLASKPAPTKASYIS